MENTTNRNSCRRQAMLVFATVVVLAGFRPGLAEDQEIKKLRQAAEQGDASAQFTLGGMYARGEGVVENLVEAATWTRQAAEQGLAKAQLRLGHMYRVAEGVPEDYVQAYAWYILAAARGEEHGFKLKDELRPKMSAEQVSEAQKLAAELSERIEPSNNR